MRRNEVRASTDAVRGRQEAAPGQRWEGLSRLLQARAVRRLGWGVADQAVSSLTNFALVIDVARLLGAAQLGSFSLAYVTYHFALNASRGLATQPLATRFTGADLPTWRRAVAACTGTATAAGLATGACVIGAAMLLDSTARSAFVALGLTMPGLLLQDSWRFAFFTLGRGSHAFMNDVIWAIFLFPGLALVQETGRGNVFWLVLVWGASATVAGLIGLWQAKVVPRISRVKLWISQNRDLGPRYFLEGTSQSVAAQLRIYGTTAIVGLAGVGYIQASTTLRGPFQILTYGMSQVMMPEAVRVLRRSPRRLSMFCLLGGGLMGAFGLAWGVVLQVALPQGLGSLVLGTIWRPAFPLVLPQTLIIVAGCLLGSAGWGLHALGAARRSLRMMLVSSAALLVGALVGALVGGTLGSVQGAAVAGWLGTLVAWWQLRAALREAGAAASHRRYRSTASPRRNRSGGRHRRSDPPDALQQPSSPNLLPNQRKQHSWPDGTEAA